MTLPLVLIGMLGAGKTSVGKQLAEKLALSFDDMDHLLEVRSGQSITSLFANEGEARFRELESELLSELVMHSTGVISAGGGVVLSSRNRALLKTSVLCIRLDLDIESLYQRLKTDSSRPLLQGGELRKRLQQIQTERESLYSDCAHVTIHIQDKSIEQICDEIAGALQKMKVLKD